MSPDKRSHPCYRHLVVLGSIELVREVGVLVLAAVVFEEVVLELLAVWIFLVR